MAGHNHEVPKNGSGIFLRPGLDSESRVESAREFRLSAHAILRRNHRIEIGVIAQIAQFDLPRRANRSESHILVRGGSGINPQRRY